MPFEAPKVAGMNESIRPFSGFLASRERARLGFARFARTARCQKFKCLVFGGYGPREVMRQRNH
ncbi:hypothetical protein CTA1_540 [Colletotrichum tanaceti]|uniref:Uncharacterized protein n=1 Tax=Colletotrichum tanaceti TaxID=1306861 RepID=A0A4U6X1R3_9PEZI|nr:hypothetical protein CTA1_540 [Colletotrichum tanaceti]